jgi:tetrahydromethanopterin S-methyltransferase subunit G
MNLSDIGSIASIVALVIIAIGFLSRTVKKIKSFNTEMKKKEDDLLNSILGAVNSASTSTTRNDVAIYVNHIISMHRHNVIQQRISILFDLIVGLIALTILDITGLGLFIFGVFIAFACMDAWLAKKIQRRIDFIEIKLVDVWGEKLIKSISMSSKANKAGKRDAVTDAPS